METEDRIAVVYLMWMPYGQNHLEAFIASYKANPAGGTHTLYILFNGAQNREQVQNCLQFLQTQQISYRLLELPQGQDITAYFFAADQVIEPYLLFLNTYSRLLHPDWLRKYRAAWQAHPGTGLIGATASCQSYVSSVFQTHPLRWESGKGLGYHFRKYKLFIKAATYWSLLFKRFPAPHIRSNAFFIRRDVFSELKGQPITNKLKAYQFESGRNSLTNQVLAKGLQALVIDKYGQAHTIANCRHQPIFWNGQQENLLVTDNQTTLFQSADLADRKKMKKLAWGIHE